MSRSVYLRLRPQQCGQSVKNLEAGVSSLSSSVYCDVDVPLHNEVIGTRGSPAEDQEALRIWRAFAAASDADQCRLPEVPEAAPLGARLAEHTPGRAQATSCCRLLPSS